MKTTYLFEYNMPNMEKDHIEYTTETAKNAKAALITILDEIENLNLDDSVKETICNKYNLEDIVDFCRIIFRFDVRAIYNVGSCIYVKDEDEF